jgi:hypothetical protein
MRKFFYILGIIFAVLIVAIGIAVFAAIKSTNAVDAEAKQYVDQSLAAILPKWNSDELLRRASPQFKEATNPGDLRALFDTAVDALGGLTDYQGARSQGANVSAFMGAGTIATATFLAQAQFQKGTASITVKVRKVDGTWMIDLFDVGSPELMRRMTGRAS